MEELVRAWGPWGVFASAFLSSTLLPGGSEAMLAGVALHEVHPPWLLLTAATAGNTLGGVSSWLLGWLAALRWPAATLENPRQLQAASWLEQHGSPLLLLSWLPLIGDPLCLAAGWLRIRFWPALMFIAIGKAARYGILLLLLQ